MQTSPFYLEIAFNSNILCQLSQWRSCYALVLPTRIRLWL